MNYYAHVGVRRHLSACVCVSMCPSADGAPGINMRRAHMYGHVRGSGRRKEKGKGKRKKGERSRRWMRDCDMIYNEIIILGEQQRPPSDGHRARTTPHAGGNTGEIASKNTYGDGKGRRCAIRSVRRKPVGVMRELCQVNYS